MKAPKLIKILEEDPNYHKTREDFVLWKDLVDGTKILGFQKDYRATDIRTVGGVFRPDFNMIDYYLIDY